MKELYIKQLRLKNYRNFSNFKIQTPNNTIILTGENGSGKTNILESISLIFPGRGIRSAKFQEIARNNQHNFSAQYILESKLGTAEIINDFNFEGNKRTVQFNGTNIPANDLNKLTSIMWLTPQMNGIFLEAPKIRRKFLDRIVYNFDFDYANYISKYEYYIQERIKLLRTDNSYNDLLNDYEKRIGLYAFYIVKTRCKILSMLQQALDDIQTDFPKVTVKMGGEFENRINQGLELDEGKIIEYILDSLKTNRGLDKITGKTSFGPHKSDLLVINAKKNVLAKYCSTGEQKAMLISILIAQINLCMKENNFKPIILLDEVFTSLDQVRKDYLIEYFSTINLQLWITATDLNGIKVLTKHAHHVDLSSIHV